MTRPEVSVVVPTRDRCTRLPLALRSALAQRDVELEVVVVDDGSRDRTQDVLASAAADPRVRRVRRASPGGVGTARNDGIAVARGRWIAFLDDDDVWAPEKLSAQLQALRSSAGPWAYAGDVVVDADLRVLGGAPPPTPSEVLRSLPRHNAVPAGASNVVVSSEVLREVGGFDATLATSEDWDLWLRLARVGAPAYVPRPLVAVTLHAGNASADTARMLEEIETIRRRYGVPVDRARHLRWAAWNALRDHRRVEAAGYYLRAAAVGDARSLLRAAAVVLAPERVAARASLIRAPSSAAWIAEAGAWLEEVTRWLETSSSR